MSAAPEVVFSAARWNLAAADLRRALPLMGERAALDYSPEGVQLNAKARAAFSHPWRVRAFWETLPPEEQTPTKLGEWRATLEPGFLNGRDVFIDMPASWPAPAAPPTNETRPVALTDDPEPFLSLTAWRNPLRGKLNQAAALDGSIAFGAGEGYPAFFEALGVRPASKGGHGLAGGDPPADPERTREIRALDIVLTTPRLGAQLSVEVLDPFADGFTHQLSTTYQNGYFLAKGGRSFLSAVAEFAAFDADPIPSPLLGLLLGAGDPQADSIKLATVYVVSPAGAGPDAAPDATWEAYPRHSVFWNLAHASRFRPPTAPPDPLRISTGLGLGLLDYLGNALLAPINSGFDEVAGFLNAGDLRGLHWTV